MKSINFYDLNELGFIIYKARQKRGYTQSQLGALCHESKSNICLIETNKVKKITVYRIEKILKVLNVNIKYCVIY
jgi:transcriptional regulator with XRE-family HTH domain